MPSQIGLFLPSQIGFPFEITDSQHFDDIFLLSMMVDFLLGTSNLHLIGFLTISFLTLILF